MAAVAIETVGLRKVYADKVAVADLTLEVGTGECFGLLGPNGAGKSTSLKMLLGLVRPSAGLGRLLGRPLGEREARRRVGFLPEHFHFYDWLSGAELLQLHGRLYGMEPARLRRRVPELLRRVGLEGRGRQPIGQYSKGMQQRIGLAQALLNDPEVIFLDEPTSGLDPLGRRLVRDIIAEQRARGATVFLNSHLLAEVEPTCDRVAFVKAGRVLQTRTLAQGGPCWVRLRARRLPAGWPQGMAAAAVRDGEYWRMELASDTQVAGLVRQLVEGGADVLECTPVRPTLEQQYLDIIGTEGGPE